MNTNKKSKMKTIMLGSVALPAALFVAHAFADKSDIEAINKANISLIEAVEAATKHNGGKALEASIDDDSFKPEYEVSVLRDNRIYEVRVNAENAEVIGEREDND